MQVPEDPAACTRSSMAAFAMILPTTNLGCLRTVPFDDLMAARRFLLHPFSRASSSLLHSVIQDFSSSESLSLTLLTLPLLILLLERCLDVGGVVC